MFQTDTVCLYSNPVNLSSQTQVSRRHEICMSLRHEVRKTGDQLIKGKKIFFLEFLKQISLSSFVASHFPHYLENLYLLIEHTFLHTGGSQAMLVQQG